MKIILTLSAIFTLLSVSCTKQEAQKSESSIVPYPLETCLVSGEKLGSMGDPVVIQHEGREIKFCCDSCVPKFESDPEKYLKQLN